MSKKPSLIQKEDGSYYTALEDGMYYPYEDDTGVVTIGFGRTNAAIKGLDILNDYSKGITVKEANDFLTTDIFNKFTDTKRKYNNKYGEGEFSNLGKTEQFMLTDYVYNLGYLFPKFTEAIRTGNTGSALNEYKRYQYQNKGEPNEIKEPIGRNDNYLEYYLQDWVDSKTPKKKMQTKGNVTDDILNLNKEVDAFAKEYAQSENFKIMLKGQGYNESEMQSIIDDIIAFNPDENITFDTDNPSAGTAYNPAWSLSSGRPNPMGGNFMDEGVTNLNYNPNAGPPNHPFFNMWEQIVAHEGGHLGFMENKLNKKTRKALKSLIYPGSGSDTYHTLRDQGVSRKDAKKAVKHSEDPYEIRANLFQLRYQLQKDGIYNSLIPAKLDGELTENGFTIEHLKEIMEFDENGGFLKYKDKYQNEFFNNVHPQDIVWMMNNIASNEEELPEGTMRAQHGGEVYQNRGNVRHKGYSDWKNFVPSLTFPDEIPDDEKNIENMFARSMFIKDMINSSDLSEYEKELHRAHWLKQHGFADQQHTNKIRHGEPLILPWNVKWGSDPSHRENYIFTHRSSAQKEIEAWEDNLSLLQGHPLYGGSLMAEDDYNEDEAEFYQTRGNVEGHTRRCSGGRCEDEYPSTTGYYIFNDNESRTMGLENAPDGTSATFLWNDDEGLDARVLEGRQSFPVAIYADGIYQGVLNPGEKLITNPAMRIDEIPLGYAPGTEVSNYLTSMAPTTRTSLRDKHNTELDEDQMMLYNLFKKEFDIKDDSEDDMDIKGIFASGKYKELEGFSDEEYRKPNHPLFTDKSLYSNLQTMGGKYNRDGQFEPSKTNMQYNSVDMLLTALSETGGSLALAPYFQVPASQPVDHMAKYSENASNINNARNIRQVAEHGGPVYNQMSDRIKSLINENRKLRTEYEGLTKYQSKMAKYQNQGRVMLDASGNEANSTQVANINSYRAVSNPPNVPTYSDYTMFFGDDGTEYNFGNAYQKGNDWYFKNEGGRDYRVKDKERSNQLTQFSNMVTLENNWDVIYDKNDKLKIDLKNPNSWTDQEALSFQKINSLMPIIDYNMGYYGTDDPNKIREKYNFNQNDLLWNYVSKPALSGVMWLGEGVMPTNFNELLMITGGGVLFNKIFKHAANSPRLRKAFGMSSKDAQKVINQNKKNLSNDGVTITNVNGIKNTTGSPRIGKVKGYEKKIMIDGEPGIGNRLPKNWESNYLPWLKNYIKRRTNYYKSDQYVMGEIKNHYPHLFDKRGNILRGQENLVNNYKDIYRNNINMHIKDMDGNININFNANKKGSTLADFGNRSTKTQPNYSINVYNTGNVRGNEMMNSIRHEINHMFSAVGRNAGGTRFMARGVDIMDNYSIGPYNPNLAKNTNKLYFTKNQTSKDLNIKGQGDYKNYFTLEVHPSFRGRYSLNGEYGTIQFGKNNLPQLRVDLPNGQFKLIDLVETKTGQQLLNEVDKRIVGYTQNLEKRMGSKSGWTKKELADYDQWVTDQKEMLKSIYNDGNKINPKRTYITNNKLQGKEDYYTYHMKAHEQQVKAMTARDIIARKYPDLKLGDYTDEHAQYLFNQLYKLNGNKTRYLSVGPHQDLHSLYNILKAGNGDVLELGSREWFKVITSHLNKAYGVAGVGTVGSQLDD